jgi:hypothetical protein
MPDYGKNLGTLGIETLPNARENYISRMSGGHPDQLYDNKINRIISESQTKQDRWEELGGPNYGFVTPGKTLNMPQYPVLNKNKISPGWLEAKNKTYGLPGTEVAQSKWKEKFRSIIDMIMSREGLDEKDAKKYIFDNYGLAVNAEEQERRQLEDWNAQKDWELNYWDTTRDERYSETIQKLVLDRIINPQNYNSEPGTGDLYPLIADPYWNI